MDALRKLIKEIAKEELEEITTSAATPGYLTPKAFRGSSKSGKDKTRKNANQAGYKLVNDLEENNDV
jgi:hypothetical protein